MIAGIKLPTCTANHTTVASSATACEQRTSMRKPETKPTIRQLNQKFVRLERDGIYTPLECMRQRGDFSRLAAPRPKRSRNIGSNLPKA